MPDEIIGTQAGPLSGLKKVDIGGGAKALATITPGLTPLAPISVPCGDTEATQLSETSIPCKTVMVIGDPDNTDNVFIGVAGEDNQLVPLAPAQSFFIPASDLNQLYGLAAVDQEAVIVWPFN